MKLIDEQYIETPFYGIDKMTEWLRRQGHYVNHKRVRRLMRQMGLEAVYPRRKRGLSVPDKQHKIYPYLLRNVQIISPDQVWSADLTYIRMYRGWLYLVAVMDWFSRYVLSWEISITLESEFCVSALKEALSLGKPDIFNTDQGSQFTSIDFTKVLLNAGVQISMDGKGRVFDNIFAVFFLCVDIFSTLLSGLLFFSLDVPTAGTGFLRPRVSGFGSRQGVESRTG